MLRDRRDMQVLLHTGLDRVGLFWTTQLLRNVFLRRHDGSHLCQREPDVLLQLCGDDWEPVTFHHEVGKSLRLRVSESDGVGVYVAVSYEIGGGLAFRLVVRGALALTLAPSHGLRSAGGVFDRR